MITAPTCRLLNGLGLLAVSAVLAAAFLAQFVEGDIPCPLCILQRAGFAGVALGLALNLRCGPRPSHYAVAILSALIGGGISARQVLLHIAPGDAGYGGTLLGLHLYSWALLLFVVIVAGCALLLLFDRQFDEAGAPRSRLPSLGLPALGMAVLALAALLVLGNGVSTVLECGAGLCPDNPVDYQLLR
ncbi:disulfide bond formation protein B [Roseomonas sp. 18066]|uniref:disulfide bond formation protein B n=1 Tax=Roseomonas sp. 18066 TaxID=2681412 RepID=UPI00135BD2B1|nr:disulfide bond formation protein B [Roseomonas sp. 18066]